MVTVTVPVVAVALAVSVTVLDTVAGLGLKAAVTSVGRPEADSWTLPVKPFTAETEIVLLQVVPPMMATLLVGADGGMSGAAGALTVRVGVVVLVRVPEAPVTVTLTVPVVAVGL